MGAGDHEPLHPNEYPMASSWFGAIAPRQKQRRLESTGFPLRNWNPDILSMVTLAEFATTDWRDKLDPGPPPGDKETARELDQLVKLANEERAGRISEILAQYSGHHMYYRGLLMVRKETHPATCLLLKIGSRITEMTMAYFKYKYNRPRPPQRLPLLLPPLDTTAHPSYPNGHALFGLMKSYCVGDAVPQMKEPMLELAKRVWENAEIGGFHYPSDAEASRKIADAAMPLLRSCDSYQRAVEATKAEWEGMLAPEPRPPAQGAKRGKRGS
jgi:acid phosphatase (class A)